MELDLGKIKFEDLSYEGDVIIELPEHYALLPYEERTAALNSPGRHRLIVAAGRDPDGNVTVVTGRGRIYTLDSKRFDLPFGRVMPGDGGQTLEFVEAGKLIVSAELIQFL